MKKILQGKLWGALLSLIVLISVDAYAQRSITAGGVDIVEDFTSLTGTSWTNNTTPVVGWYARTTNTSSITTIGSNTGATTTAGLYSFGVAGTNLATDRALGYATSNSYTGSAGSGYNYLGWRLKNNTGSEISSLTITYTGEQWRRENNAATQSLTVQYQVGATVTNVNSGTWVEVEDLTFTSPQASATTAAALDGNAAANRETLSATINVSIPAGQEIMIRWSDLNDANTDHILAIDDVKVNAVVANPEINITGNGIDIVSGDATPSETDGTDFGVMSTAAGTVVRTFTIENTGNAALTLSGTPRVALSGDAAFTVTAQPAASVAASGSTTFEITFDPSVVGTANATVSIANNDANENPYTFAITGEGSGDSNTADYLALVTFNASTVYGQTGATLQAIIGEDGMTSISGENTDITVWIGYSADNTDPSTGGWTWIPASFESDASAELDRYEAAFSSTFAEPGIYYTAVRAQIGGGPYAYGGTLGFWNNDSGTITVYTPADINVQGNGVTIVNGDATPSTDDETDFGTTTVGSSIVRTYTIQNTGGVNLTLGSVFLLDGAAGFSVTQPVASTVLPGQSTTFAVTYNPSVVGSNTDEVVIESADADEAEYSFSISASAGLATPVATAATDVTGNSFVANWGAVAGATGYRLDVASNSFDTTMAVSPWINEFHYDNSGTDSNEFVEVVVPNSYTGTNLTVTFYNGGNNGPYATPVTLSGMTLGETTSSYKVYYVSGVSGGIQNGNPDGFSLSDDSGVIQFLSYGGTFTAASGPAQGVTSVDVGLTQGSSTPVGSSIYLSGAGSQYGDFVWASTTSNTRGNTNTGQTIQVASAVSYIVEDLAVSETSQLVPGLEEDTTYYYRVRAVADAITSANSNVIEVTTAASPATFGTVSQPLAACENTDATLYIDGLVPSSTSTISYTINGGSVQTLTGVVANGTGFAMAYVPVTLANNGQVLEITEIVRTDVASAPVAVTENNTVTLAVNAEVTYYVDADGDGFGSNNGTVTSCDGFAPAGYADNNTDCDDANASVWQMDSFYVDADGDGYDAGTAEVCYGDTTPAGYNTTSEGSDCDDNDADVYQTAELYVDADGDGYTSGETAEVCYGATAPAGYVLELTAIDCNDALASVNPGATEIPYNGIDDNCDGTIDEGSQVFSQVQASQCGTTLTNIGSLIGLVSVPGATGYRIEVTNLSTDAVYEITRTVPNFSLMALPSYDYATTYAIRVMVQRNGVWLNYWGPVCNVSSPAITAPGGASQVNPSQCNITLAKINTLIATTSLPGVAQYRFRVTNLTDPEGPNAVQIIDRTLHWFSLQMLTRYNYGTTYSIEVAIRTTNSANFGGFGAPCNITTPAVPTLVNCGQTIASNSTYVATTSLTGVTSYRFILTDMVDFTVTTFDRPQHWFTFGMIPGYVPGRMYGVQVAVMTTGEWSPEGEGCEITAPGAARENVKETTVPFDAVAYPNPFADAFAISLSTSAESDVNVKVYDMTGRMLQNETVSPSALETMKVGERFPAGVYNVIVTQGDDAKTLRVIKR